LSVESRSGTENRSRRSGALKYRASTLDSL
jgi:hypothetical protein